MTHLSYINACPEEKSVLETTVAEDGGRRFFMLPYSNKHTSYVREIEVVVFVIIIVVTILEIITLKIIADFTQHYFPRFTKCKKKEIGCESVKSIGAFKSISLKEYHN